jgi:hypothetical protein
MGNEVSNSDFVNRSGGIRLPTRHRTSLVVIPLTRELPYGTLTSRRTFTRGTTAWSKWGAALGGRPFYER